MYVGSLPCASTAVVSETALRCDVPNGVGANLTVAVRLKNASFPGFLSSPPSSALFRCATPQAAAANNTADSYASPVVSNVEYLPPPTAGGANITVFGANFGPAGAEVFLGDTVGVCAVCPGVVLVKLMALIVHTAVPAH